jgi:Gpi18-like mannosyltransferase
MIWIRGEPLMHDEKLFVSIGVEGSESLPEISEQSTIRIANVSKPPQNRVRLFINFWLPALKQIFPYYLVAHIVFIVLSLYAPVLMLPSTSSRPDLPISMNSLSVIWRTWDRFDSVDYLLLAKDGYGTNHGHAAFFPLFPMLVHGITLGIFSVVIGGLIISSLAGLVLMIVLYQLALEEWGVEVAKRAVLYLLVFPTAFFLWAIYPESLFLCLVVLSFYAMRHNHWWVAALFGLLACLTRPNGIFLFLPFCFEYLRQRSFRWQAIRWDVLSGLLIPLGLVLFSLYCYYHYGDALAFSHAQIGWKRTFHAPWYGIIQAIQIAFTHQSVLKIMLATSLDLFPDLFALLLIVVSAVGLCRLGSRHWSYVLFAASLWLFANVFPAYQPLMGVGRNMLVIFPLFLILAQLGRNRWFHLLYVSVAGSLCFLWAIQFITGYRII